MTASFNPSRRHLLVAAGASALVAPLPAAAQAYPSRPVRIVVPFAPGGVADITARTVAAPLSQLLGQPVVVENRPGAGGVVAGDAVAKAEPDGHTLLLMSNGTAVSASLFRSLPFDTLRDFAPVSTLGTFDIAVVVDNGSRLQTLADLLQQARANPGKLNIGTIAVGSTQNLAAELFKSAAGIDVQVVPYNGTPAVMTALRGGQIDAMVEILGPVLPQISGGAMRALAVTGERRATALPQVPTAREAGVPGLVAASWNAMAAPARTPREVVQRLQRDLASVLAQPEVRAKLAAANVDARSSTPEQASELLASEVRRWGEVIRRANVPLQ